MSSFSVIFGRDLLDAEGNGLDMSKCLAAAGPRLTEAANADRSPVSVTLDLAAEPRPEDVIEFSSHIDKRTRSLAFVRVEARAPARLIFSVSAIYATRGRPGGQHL